MKDVNESGDTSDSFENISIENLKYEKKVREIKYFLLNTPATRDAKYLDQLRSFALSEGGLVNDEIRKQVWPLLIDLQPEEFDEAPSPEEYENHIEYSQVVLDVNRSIKRFPPGIPYESRVAMQDQLVRLILRVIMKYPQLQYYQGYHDVAITFLLVVGENIAFHIMEKLSTNHLKHFMEPTMEKTSELLEYIFPLMNHVHPELCDYLERAEVGTMFCLPWFLTWYSHTLTKYEHVGRLYDYFLASEALIPLYLVPMVVIHRQDDVFATECDMASLHQVLSQLPDELPFDDLLIKATQLYHKYPPGDIHKEVIAWKQKREKLLSVPRKPVKPVVQKPASRGWQFVQRVIPQWFLPYGKIPFVLVSASFVVGLYAYYRYTNPVDGYD
ncbi:TBC1 domain family member 20 [Planococcus citri]|uniref:TBC1 domain family member 20 n=1 Tax=Planococcus citri TaxID=170843 RepID=UPI0031F9C760